MRHRSKDGLMTSADPAAVALWDDICSRADAAASDWSARLRSAGVKLAHPDDGWVDRERSKFTLSWYPTFDDRPEVGDLIAFGSPPQHTRWDDGDRCYYQPSRDWQADKNGKVLREPESSCSGYRICRVTKVERRSSILGYHQDFEYEDTGVRMPPRRPASRLRLLLGRWL